MCGLIKSDNVEQSASYNKISHNQIRGFFHVHTNVEEKYEV